ncbi:MAG TPA: polysaccharide biosynthesis/export family protein [Byssovorax sp.]|jgi:polysaccharide export outer membrane protein
MGRSLPAVAASLATLALSVVACKSAVYAQYDYKKEFDPRTHEYQVGVGDALTINVFHQTEMSAGVVVRQDGVVTLPLVGDVVVAGKTPSQIRDDMQKRVAKYVKDEGAIVTVAVASSNSYRFVVAGNVGHPGSFAQHYYVTVSEALAMAGGPSRFAGDEVLIYRVAPSGLRTIPVSYSDVTSGHHPEQDLALVSGDTIFVP